MEVAAQALSLHRVDGIMFDAALFTNFGQEHAEFYPTDEKYFSAKKSILNHLKPAAPLFVNAYDPRTACLAHEYPHTLTFGSYQGEAQSHGSLVSSSLEGLVFEFRGEKDTSWTGHAPALMGDFNLSNVLGAIVCAQYFNVSKEYIIQGLATFEGVPGRLNRYALPNGAWLSSIMPITHHHLRLS